MFHGKHLHLLPHKDLDFASMRKQWTEVIIRFRVRSDSPSPILPGTRVKYYFSFFFVVNYAVHSCFSRFVFSCVSFKVSQFHMIVVRLSSAKSAIKILKSSSTGLDNILDNHLQSECEPQFEPNLFVHCT